MKLSLFYGLSILAMVGGNVDIEIVQKVGDDSYGKGRGAEEGEGGGQTTTTTTTTNTTTTEDPLADWDVSNGIYFRMSQGYLTRASARTYCRNLGGDLVDAQPESRAALGLYLHANSVGGTGFRVGEYLHPDNGWVDVNRSVASEPLQVGPSPLSCKKAALSTRPNISITEFACHRVAMAACQLHSG